MIKKYEVDCRNLKVDCAVVKGRTIIYYIP